MKTGTTAGQTAVVGQWWPWKVCVFLLLATALSYLDRQALSIVAPLVSKELSLDNANPLRLTNALAKVYGKKSYEDNYGDVLKSAYFDAIGMRGWAASPRYDGVVLNLDLEDMGRLGLLVLARGRWEGKELIPQWFVEQLEKKQTSGMKVNYDGPNDGKIDMAYKEAPYGFITWVNTDGNIYPKADRAWVWGSGSGGHAVFWNHKLGIVFAAQGRNRDAAFPEIIEANIIAPNPLLKSAKATPTR